jgi:hypothetical protein
MDLALEQGILGYGMAGMFILLSFLSCFLFFSC